MTETYLSNYLASKAAASKRKMIASCVVSILLATCGIVAGMTLNSALYALVIPSVGVLLVTPRHRSSWEYGTEGEERLQRHLKQILDERCEVFYNLPVASGDLDVVIVAPQGVWAFESKNYSGEISCAQGHWCRAKRRGDEVSIEAMRSPSEQLTRAIMHLKSYLLSQGIHTWVRGIVVFTNPRVSLHATGLGNVSATTLSGLTSLPPGPELPEPTRHAIIEALSRLTPQTAMRRCA